MCIIARNKTPPILKVGGLSVTLISLCDLYLWKFEAEIKLHVETDAVFDLMAFLVWKNCVEIFQM